ncbi:hypothetical protein COV24_04850 [candidate division WWE3 bacterium CG10_big_fil_rev_8_21_14_0_10_32_10]|uniref:Uncharacterized protein n=1 Tax=candidate division WWE3 bacterium CG10_big_fil_rev_8_21_14_0_10_32_10 TaxID=1975090 RepID=A0A2H0RB30_UNCKA|nr:MAG: hypothetical protein COV24_04850 [candidate division WWE3 bacterium CG10_big_fil_rev_8_21_14_0_10_32_10]
MLEKTLQLIDAVHYLVIPKIYAAAPTIDLTDNAASEPTDITTLSDIVNLVINTVFVLGLAASLLFVIIGGIKYVTSQGDQTKAEEARNTITNAIIGAVVIVAFRVILSIALNIIGGGTLDTILK